MKLLPDLKNWFLKRGESPRSEIIPRKKSRTKSSSWPALFWFLKKMFVLLVKTGWKKAKKSLRLIMMFLCSVLGGASLDNKF